MLFLLLLLPVVLRRIHCQCRGFKLLSQKKQRCLCYCFANLKLDLLICFFCSSFILVTDEISNSLPKLWFRVLSQLLPMKSKFINWLNKDVECLLFAATEQGIEDIKIKHVLSPEGFIRETSQKRILLGWKHLKRVRVCLKHKKSEGRQLRSGMTLIFLRGTPAFLCMSPHTVGRGHLISGPYVQARQAGGGMVMEEKRLSPSQEALPCFRRDSLPGDFHVDLTGQEYSFGHFYLQGKLKIEWQLSSLIRRLCERTVK